MSYVLMAAFLLSSVSSQVIYDFNEESTLRNWRIVDDVVMGGVSDGNLRIYDDGNAVFDGYVSLDNNGGFSSARYSFDRMRVNEYSKIILRLKGDGKDYQFRVKSNAREFYSYVTTFSTTGEWQEVEIPLSSMYPSFRGRKLNRPNFSHSVIEELSILIANNRNESFRLVLDKIELSALVSKT